MIPLQTGIVYGPVRSKRLGRSLGINLFPADKKVCSFDCVYCHFGRTSDHTRSAQGYAVPTVAEVLSAVEAQLASDVGFEFITLSGNGEPTMYPEFSELVSRLKVLKNQLRPEVRLALLSNSSTVTDHVLWPALLEVDMPVFKLDAGDQATFEALNHPCPGLLVSAIVEALARLSAKGRIWLQSALVSAPVDNHQGSAFEAWLAAVRRIRPRAIQLYTTDRPVPDTRVMKLTDTELEAIAAKVRALTGIPATAY